MLLAGILYGAVVTEEILDTSLILGQISGSSFSLGSCGAGTGICMGRIEVI